MVIHEIVTDIILKDLIIEKDALTNKLGTIEESYKEEKMSTDVLQAIIK